MEDIVYGRRMEELEAIAVYVRVHHYIHNGLFLIVIFVPFCHLGIQTSQNHNSLCVCVMVVLVSLIKIFKIDEFVNDDVIVQ